MADSVEEGKTEITTQVNETINEKPKRKYPFQDRDLASRAGKAGSREDKSRAGKLASKEDKSRAGKMGDPVKKAGTSGGIQQRAAGRLGGKAVAAKYGRKWRQEIGSYSSACRDNRRFREFLAQQEAARAAKEAIVKQANIDYENMKRDVTKGIERKANEDSSSG